MELTDPTLVGTRVWEQLLQFARAARYRTLTVAAQELGVRQVRLISRINYLESELDLQLRVRAERGRPTQLTDNGIWVMASLRKYKHTGRR